MSRVLSRIGARGSFIAAVLALVLFTAATALAQSGTRSKQGFMALPSKRAVYFEYEMPNRGMPTMVLVNGLTYSTEDWNRFVRPLSGKGYGLLRFDFPGQGETLVKAGPAKAPFHYMDQVRDMKALMDRLKINQPVHLIGLSYGGAIAILFGAEYPALTKSIIAMAPFIAPIKGQDDWIRLQISSTRLMFPLNPYSDDEIYDYFLRNIIYQTYPAAEPVILSHPYRLEAVFRLVQGIRKFVAVDMIHELPLGKLHLMLGTRDQYLPNPIHDEFWDQVPNDLRASRLYIKNSEHKIPETVPNFAASWIEQIVTGNPKIGRGVTYHGDPKTGVVKVDRTVHQLSGFAKD